MNFFRTIVGTLIALVLCAATEPARAQNLIPLPDHDYDANNCEFYVNALGFQSRHYGGGGYDERTVVTYISVNAADLVHRDGGRILRVGMLTNSRDWLVGSEVEPAYYLIRKTLFLIKPYTETIDYRLNEFVYFIDVQRASGEVDRLWLKDGDHHFGWPSVLEGYPQYRVDMGPAYDVWAKEPSPVYNQKSLCAR